MHGLCVATILTVMAVGPALAQDLKPVSASLAHRIEASGRKTVAVIDFTDLQGNVTELGRFLAEELSVDLVNDAKSFKVIDRTHLKAILHEHKLASTGLIDPQTARQLGRIAGVDALVTGTLTPLGDSVRLSAKVLDTETATMIAASTVNVPKTKAIEELLSRGIGSQQSANVGSGSTAGASTSSLPKPTGSLPSFKTDIFRLVVTSLRKTARFLEVVITAESKGNETVRFKLGRGPSMPWSYNYQLLDESGNSGFGGGKGCFLTKAGIVCLLNPIRQASSED